MHLFIFKVILVVELQDINQEIWLVTHLLIIKVCELRIRVIIVVLAVRIDLYAGLSA